jgi:dTDP-4-dehydrorhamnose reductase
MSRIVRDKEKILLLGSTGKMGTAISEIFNNDYEIIGKNSSHINVRDFEKVEDLIKEYKPHIVINTVAYLGIDPCEIDPELAFDLNAKYPKLLAELSSKLGYTLVHFSTDAVFNDEKGDYYVESDTPAPLNLYGQTKHEGDKYIQTIADKYYIFRIPILFGKTFKDTQFVEKMLCSSKDGCSVLRVANDIISSPTYNKDVAARIKDLLEAKQLFGLYHIANEGKASLYELMKKIKEHLSLEADIAKASYKDFSFIGTKNTFTPIKSEKIGSLRSWQEAVKDYCDSIKRRENNG